MSAFMSLESCTRTVAQPWVAFQEATQVDIPQLEPLASLYNEEALSDIVVKAGSTTMHAHRAVLAAHSPSMRAMFQATVADAACFQFQQL